jgi:hypothetical protein
MNVGLNSARFTSTRWCFVRYLLRCFSAAFYNPTLPHFAKLGDLRSA